MKKYRIEEFNGTYSIQKSVKVGDFRRGTKETWQPLNAYGSTADQYTSTKYYQTIEQAKNAVRWFRSGPIYHEV